ncbi:MAG: HAD family phosphatase [Verrucomicrobia bacterium]|nr:HAD family phosphatase [Verrucomicrobiota bacterium]
MNEPAANHTIRVILFDLGGVLVEFDGIAPLITLSGNRLDKEGARRFWLTSPSVRQLETGKCGADEFARSAVAELGLTMAPDAFLRQFVSWDRGPMDGALSLLDALKPRFLLACLSNNNELHWSRLCDETTLPGKFHRCYLSQEIGLMKPDPASFSYVIRDLETAPEHILFFDDNPECVEAAQRLGLHARRARGVEEVKAVLAELGLYPDNAG